MVSIGEQFMKTRESKNLTLDQVADETNIAKRYLEAMETENFDVFPGDTYAIGFIRNYSEYLGLKPDEFINAFKNMKIQEQQVPLEELIPQKNPRKGIIAALISVLSVLLVTAIILAIVLIPKNIDPAAEQPERSLANYELAGAPVEKRFFIGDTITVSVGQEKFRLAVTAIDDTVAFETPLGINRFSLGDVSSVDLTGEGAADISVFVSDLSKGEPDKGAIIKFELSAALSVIPAETVTAAPTVEEVVETVAIQKPDIVFDAQISPYPFVMIVTFRGYCLFRYEIDKKDRLERYYKKGETITVTANNGIKIWVSNAGACKVTIQASGGKSADLSLGESGQVTVKNIKWYKNDTGTYTLGVFPID